MAIGSPNGWPLSGSSGGGSDPATVGDVVFAPTAPTAGTWLECNGQRVSQASYADLYAAIGLRGVPPCSRLSPVSAGASSTKNGAAYGGGAFVTVGSSGAIRVSTDDGATWAAPGTTPNSSDLLIAVGYGNSTWVAVGGFLGVIWSAGDPTGTWTSRTSGTVVILSGVAYGAGVFVVVGPGGTILTSPDGATWTSRTSGTSVTLSSVAFGGGLFVAVGASGTILTSPDGTTWTSRTSGTSASIGQVVYGATKFMASGSAGLLLSSSDGSTWTKMPVPAILNSLSLTMAYGGSGIFAAQSVFTGGMWISTWDESGNWNIGFVSLSTGTPVAMSTTSIVLAAGGTTVHRGSAVTTYDYDTATLFQLPLLSNANSKAWIKAA